MKKRQKVQKKKWWVFGAVISGIIMGGVILFVAILLNCSQDDIFEERNLPILNIKLNGIGVDDVYKDGKDVVFEDNKIEVYKDNLVSEYDGVEMKGRGNTTSTQPKKPYQIKFKKKVDLIGLGAAKKWVLLANYLDTSQIRNDVALNLAEMLESKYSYRGDFVELYINDDYQGQYYLVRKIEISKGSVDLRNEQGVLFELDNLHSGNEKCYESVLGDCLVLKDTVSKNEETYELGVQDFMSEFDGFAEAAKNGKYDEILNYIDVDSFAKYYLVNEFTVNPDAYSSSFYLYKDGTDDKIHAGLVWDFDLALGNRKWSWRRDDEFLSPMISEYRRSEAFGKNGFTEDLAISKIIYYLMDIPEFREDVKTIFQNYLSGRKSEVIGNTLTTVKKIRLAVEEDNKKWEIESFDEEIRRLVEWMGQRYDYFEKVYGVDGKKKYLDFL